MVYACLSAPQRESADQKQWTRCASPPPSTALVERALYFLESIAFVLMTLFYRHQVGRLGDRWQPAASYTWPFIVRHPLAYSKVIDPDGHSLPTEVAYARGASCQLARAGSRRHEESLRSHRHHDDDAAAGRSLDRIEPGVGHQSAPPCESDRIRPTEADAGGPA